MNASNSFNQPQNKTNEQVNMKVTFIYIPGGGGFVQGEVWKDRTELSLSPAIVLMALQ